MQFPQLPHALNRLLAPPRFGKSSLALNWQQASKEHVRLIQLHASLDWEELAEELRQDPHDLLIIDDYDVAVLAKLGDVKAAKQELAALQSFLMRIQAAYPQILLLGSYRFALPDLAIHELNYAPFDTLLGFTQAEIRFAFAPHIPTLCQKTGLSEAELLKEIERWYGGYSVNGEGYVHNPYSLRLLFEQMEFRPYWFEEEKVPFLPHLFRHPFIAEERFRSRLVGDFFLEPYHLDGVEEYRLLVDAGFLSIQEVETCGSSMGFRLGVPNEELHLLLGLMD